MQQAFRRIAERTSAAVGSPWAFIGAVLLIVVWAVAGRHNVDYAAPTILVSAPLRANAAHVCSIAGAAVTTAALVEMCVLFVVRMSLWTMRSFSEAPSEVRTVAAQ